MRAPRTLGQAGPVLPELLSPADVGGVATWRALCRDGALVPLWNLVAHRATVPVSPAVRARALATVLHGRVVVGGTAAAWVHCGGPPPRRVTALHKARMHRPWPDAAVRVVQATLLANEVVDVGGVRVTSVQRTGLDVARDADVPSAVAWLAHLTAVGFDVRSARLALERRARWHGRSRIREVLDAFEAQRAVRPGAAASAPRGLP
ncbi:hypothetical protein [Luteimicrobium album]|uniref:hypothetical protein n=1 Tax=Luteimicrobium album TaxID=1054550 RepID=UPI0024E06FB5|nr:hypothetical protein [Luteimicrobium album]